MSTCVCVLQQVRSNAQEKNDQTIQDPTPTVQTYCACLHDAASGKAASSSCADLMYSNNSTGVAQPKPQLTDLVSCGPPKHNPCGKHKRTHTHPSSSLPSATHTISHSHTHRHHPPPPTCLPQQQKESNRIDWHSTMWRRLQFKHEPQRSCHSCGSEKANPVVRPSHFEWH